MQSHHNTRHAFTILELLVIIGIVALLIGILWPALGNNCPGSPPNVVAQANLRFLNTGSSSFAADHNDEIFALTSAEQASDILNRATGSQFTTNPSSASATPTSSSSTTSPIASQSPSPPHPSTKTSSTGKRTPSPTSTRKTPSPTAKASPPNPATT